jgi:hypothetical protein
MIREEGENGVGLKPAYGELDEDVDLYLDQRTVMVVLLPHLIELHFVSYLKTLYVLVVNGTVGSDDSVPILAKYASEGDYLIQTEDHVETTWEQVVAKE